MSILGLSVQRVVSWSKRSKNACYIIIAQFCKQDLFETLYRAIVLLKKMGRLSQYLPSHKRLDSSFMFDANLGTLEAFIHKSKKMAASPFL